MRSIRAELEVLRIGCNSIESVIDDETEKLLKKKKKKFPITKKNFGETHFHHHPPNTNLIITHTHTQTGLPIFAAYSPN